MAVDGGLSVDAEGSLQTEGSEPQPPTSYLYGPNGWVGLGAGLQINAEGQLVACDNPPYNCNTNVNPFCVTDFTNAWYDCTGLTSFPLLDVSNGTNFNAAWGFCNSLTSFPAGMFDTCTATSFSGAWYGCALDQTSVDNILVSLDTAGQSNGTVNINGGTSAAPSATGLAAKASLQAKGWTVTTN